jgi:hypothetical protein
MRSVAYEQVNDPQLRAELRAARGFCNPHAYRWLREAHSVLGTALIYRDVVQAALNDLPASGLNGARPGLLGGLLGRGLEGRSRAVCPACRAQREAEDRYLGALWTILAHPDDRALFDRSDGVCLVHARALVQRGGERAKTVVAQTQARVERLLATLDEVIRKEDYRFREEPRTDAERTAPTRAVAWTAGAEGLVVDGT